MKMEVVNAVERRDMETHPTVVPCQAPFVIVNAREDEAHTDASPQCLRLRVCLELCVLAVPSVAL